MGLWRFRRGLLHGSRPGVFTLKIITPVTACRLSLGAVWFYEGLVPKLLFIRADQVELVRRSGIYFGTPEFFLQLLGAAQVAFATWLLTGFAERMAVAIATLGMWILIVLVAMANPAMLTDPFGALIKDLCLTACAYTVWSLSPSLGREKC
ncbi:MAG TPA: DoxX-like family protein [Chthoniobacterales bacterium]|nr:DoxX-like family protein [Chthoniobacterales bacterium]